MHKKARLTSGGSLVGEHSSEFSSAHRALALGTAASPARLPDPVARVTPDAENTIQLLLFSCKPNLPGMIQNCLIILKPFEWQT